MKDESTEKDSSVPIPEDFQVAVKKLLKGANKQQLSFVQECCYECERENDKVNKEEFSTESMPS